MSMGKSTHLLFYGTTMTRLKNKKMQLTDIIMFYKF